MDPMGYYYTTLPKGFGNVYMGISRTSQRRSILYKNPDPPGVKRPKDLENPWFPRKFSLLKWLIFLIELLVSLKKGPWLRIKPTMVTWGITYLGNLLYIIYISSKEDCNVLSWKPMLHCEPREIIWEEWNWHWRIHNTPSQSCKETLQIYSWL